MPLSLHRLTGLLFVLLVCAFVPARAVTPTFLTGTSASSTDPFYGSYPFNQLPVGKTLVLPIVVSGSGPMTFTAKSNSTAFLPIIKSGYPEMDIHVTYAGTTGTFQSVFEFTGTADGAGPLAGVIQTPQGVLVGTTYTGGTNNFGTIYQLTTTGTFESLHDFSDGSDGGHPIATPFRAVDGSYYGTTGSGGALGFGVVYKVDTSGSFSVLHSFDETMDGGHPDSALITGTGGFLYGTAIDGGTNSLGTVYRISTSGSTFETLYTFTGGADGAKPIAGLTTGTDGSLFGTTDTGGAGNAGTIFRINVSGTAGAVASFTPIHEFNGFTEGGHPSGGLILATDGNFYGTTEAGGTGSFGTVYELTSTGSVNVLHSFTGGADGADPLAGLTQGSDGNLYGVTTGGTAGGLGTVFQITPTGNPYTVLHVFTGGTDGAGPFGPLVQGTNSNFYGTTSLGGTNNVGTVFSIAPPNQGAFSGTMRFALLRDMAPMTCAYIAGFAQAGYYDGLDFFRIVNLAGTSPSDFIAQAGDPSETGTGSPGFSFDNEFNTSLIFTGHGQLAMANAGINPSTFHGTNGSQFFITQSPRTATVSDQEALRSLDFNHTIFGQMLTGFDVMAKVMAVPVISGSTRPTADVVMDSVTVSEDNTDAILLISAAAAHSGGAISVTATDPAGNKATIATTGTNTTPALTINMSTYDDFVNDPPIIVPVPSVFASLRQKVSLPIKGRDLEYDYLSPNAISLANPAFAGASIAGNVVTVTPNAFSPTGTVTVGLEIEQFFASVLRSNVFDQTPVNIALGLGKLTPATPVPFTSGTAVLSGTQPAASFINSDPMTSATNYKATINWGDGVVESSSNTTVAKSPRFASQFDVLSSGTHQYVNPGLYPVTVSVTASNGEVLQLQNSAYISPGASFPIAPLGRTFTAAKGLINGQVATFTDKSFNANANSYVATINWGDGSVSYINKDGVKSNGSIKGAAGNFQVYSRHQYADGNTYPVDVSLDSRSSPGETAFGWSIATLTGVPVHQPPFSQSHIVAQLGSPGFSATAFTEQVTLFNSGNLSSGPIAIKFYIGATSATDPASLAADTPLRIGNSDSYKTVDIGPGQSISGAVSNIFRPPGVTTRGKFIIMQVITSDPIGNHMDYPRAYADPNPLID